MVALALLTGSLAGCSSQSTSGKVTLDFFQFKGEALEDFKEIIEEFEAENPDIRVVQNQVADADTTFRNLLVKNRTPDVITLNAGNSLGGLIEAGVFYDFAGDPILDTINPAVQDIIAALGELPGEVNALGYVNNANGIIYNQEIFADLGLEVPTTWDELIAVCETLEESGITPFYGTLADDWTVLPSFNGLGAYAAEGGFFDQLREEGSSVGPASPVSFSKNFQPVLEQQLELYSYAQPGYRGRTYDDGNAAFANGEAAMLMQGIWALNPIKQANPDVQAAIFPYPVPTDPNDRVVVSGVDVAVMVGKDTPHLEEALLFVDFLFRPDIIERFAASQNMIPSVLDAKLSEDPAIQSVAPFFEDEMIAGFIDHQFPPGIPLSLVVQSALFDGDPGPALSTLDSEWNKVAARSGR